MYICQHHTPIVLHTWYKHEAEWEEGGWKYKDIFIPIPYKDSIDTEYSWLEICA